MRGTLLHYTNLPLSRWPWAIYVAASDNEVNQSVPV